jgi:cyclase
MNLRIIPRLDIKGPNLVKGIRLEGLRVLGKPEHFARYYYENGADELFYMDAVASLYGRNSLVEIIRSTSKEIFIPLTVGGGLRSVEDIRTVLRAGADKVSINTAAILRPELIREASRAYGSSTIVVSIEAIKRQTGSYESYIDYGRQKTGVDAFEWAIKAVELGAGELVVTSIDNEGTGEGFDLELTRRISELVPIPVIASGGAGNVSHIILHYNCIKQREYGEDDFTREGNVEFLQGRRGNKGFSKIQDATLQEIKANLAEHGIECRYQ